MNDEHALLRHFIPVRELQGIQDRKLSREADEAERVAIADAFALVSLASLKTTFRITSEGADGWRLEGEVAARLQQRCVVTLEPLDKSVHEAFSRVFTPDGVDLFSDPSFGVGISLDDEDPPEALGKGIDVGAVALETLALSLDPYPRGPEADFTSVSSQPEGAAPLTDEAVKPFAALAALKKTMEDGS